jgi:hypothetical protein
MRCLCLSTSLRKNSDFIPHLVWNGDIFPIPLWLVERFMIIQPNSGGTQWKPKD